MRSRAVVWLGLVAFGCVAWLIAGVVLGVRQDREFVRYYNSRRSHRAPALRPPDGPVEALGEGEVTRRQVLGGLINDYHRKAA
ncbi:MAG TPA: transposase [Armatimonadota bacterium]|nr:transposase [Armatimonadota bacterium]